MEQHCTICTVLAAHLQLHRGTEHRPFAALLSQFCKFHHLSTLLSSQILHHSVPCLHGQATAPRGKTAKKAQAPVAALQTQRRRSQRLSNGLHPPEAPCVTQLFEQQGQKLYPTRSRQEKAKRLALGGSNAPEAVADGIAPAPQGIDPDSDVASPPRWIFCPPGIPARMHHRSEILPEIRLITPQWLLAGLDMFNVGCHLQCFAWFSDSHDRCPTSRQAQACMLVYKHALP